MKKTCTTLLLQTSLLMALFVPVSVAQNSNTGKPPVAKQSAKITEIHGYKLTDNYFWLREKSNPEVIKYLEDENRYTDAVMRPTEALQESLYKEMLGRIKQTDLSVPYKQGEYFYYTRTEEGKQYPYFCRKRGSLDAKEEIMLDQNKLAEGHTYSGLGALAVSDDGNWLAYSLDTNGYRQYTLYVKDLRTGQLSNEKIERTTSVLWAGDNKTLFYVTEDPVSKRNDKFYRHVVGTDKNELLYDEKDELFDIGANRSDDKKIIFLGAYSKTSNEFRYLPADQPNGELRLILPREEDHEYSVEHYRNLFYIRTKKGAKNFRVVTAPIGNPQEKNWTTFIAHNPNVKIDGLSFFADHCVVSEKESGLNQLRVINMKTKQAHRITTPEPDYSLYLNVNADFNTDTLRIGYQSMVTPFSIFDYDMNTRKRTLLKQQDVLGGYDAKQYVAERINAVARDGTKVPISVVRRRDVKLDGKAPMLLYAYGSYGASGSATFSSNRLSLLNRGAIYATAYIRGGGELGEDWREQGRMMNKLNTFTDFIDCADYLIKQRYTAKDRLVIQGGSAGGLLMGAVSNMRPDLFKAVVAQVPFVDVMNTMLDASLPLTTSEYLEWGNPNKKTEFDYMYKYSPYDNIARKDYPAMLIQVSLNDSQVPYWEGAKFAAKLRAMKTDDNPLLLKTNMGAGHGGASGRYDALRETAFTYAFMLWQMGLIEERGSAKSATPTPSK
jgi:oligopeptidase B